MVRLKSLAAAIGVVLVASACSEEQEAAPAAGGARPPAQVGIIVPQPESLPLSSDLPGRITPTRVAEVRPRVGGIVERRVFEQGATIAQGDILFEIDPRMYEIAVEAATAGVARAEATLLEARQNEERQLSLQARNIASEAALDQAIAGRLQAEADLAAAQAELHSAEVQLEYTSVRAPIAGTIGRAFVTEGALVDAGGATVLTTIQQLDPIYADIQQPVAELLRLRAALKTGEVEAIAPDVVQVRLYFDDGSLYPHQGRLLFAEATVDESSGQVTIRAEFPNPDGVLLPGLYVRVKIEQAVQNNALAVPTQAVQRNAAGQTLLWIVTPDSRIEARIVRVGPQIDNRYLIIEGLAAGEQVVVDGFQKTGPGAPVAPTPWTDPSAPSPEEAQADAANDAAADAAPAGERQ